MCRRSLILQHTHTKLSNMSDNSNRLCDDDWLASSGSEEYEEEEHIITTYIKEEAETTLATSESPPSQKDSGERSPTKKESL